MILKWLFRKFWEDAPRHHETVWSSYHEEDGIEVLRYMLEFQARQLERIADSLESMQKSLQLSYEKPIDVYLEVEE